VNQFALNLEREMVVYKLFSSESTVSWDEIWYLIRDFTSSFFLKKYQYEVENSEQRRNVKRYFQLFVAKLEMKKGNYKEAGKMLQQIIADPTIDEAYEQLFVARVYEAIALCAKDQGDDRAYQRAVNGFYNSYPQLVPFSDLRVDFKLNVSGQADKKLVSRLKDCNINWNDRSTLTVRLDFEREAQKQKVSFSVTDRDGREIVKRDAFVYTDSEKAALYVAYRLFNIGIKSNGSEQNAG